MSEKVGFGFNTDPASVEEAMCLRTKYEEGIIFLWDKTDGKPWEPPEPNSRIVLKLLGSGFVERCDMRCGFEAFKDSGLRWTEAGKIAVQSFRR